MSTNGSLIWKAFFTSHGDKPGAEYATNGMEFATRDEAIEHGQALFARWLGAKSWGVAPVTEATKHDRRPVDTIEVIV